jgi:glutamate---cysteine ligase / carboxylate-amine ligase
VRLGVTEDYTRIWWDVRPHPKLGTLEVRVPDQPTDVHLSAAFAALLQALCAAALEGVLPRDESALGDRGRADYVQNRWSAARFGPRAKLLHPDGQSYVLASELAAELLELVRPAARTLDAETFLDRLDPGTCEADLQLQSDTALEAAADVVARSVG